MKKPALHLIVTAALALPAGAVTIISDSFDRADSGTLGTADVGGTWTTGTGFSINSNQAQFIPGGTGVRISQLHYSAITLSSADSTWGFNGRLARSSSNPDWGTRGGYGMILAADNADLTTTVGVASGYALVTGNFSTGNNTLALVSFTGGFDPSNWTEIIAAPAGFVGSQQAFTTVRVEYTSSTNTWELFAATGGSFSDPLGTLSSQGTAVNSLYTGNSMVTSGIAARATGGATLSVHQFDNVSFSQVPEPSTFGLLALGLLGTVASRRRSLCR